ncbi:MAG: hypothetical protein HOL85_22580 [Rhodospirillaceae bacterium]|nr:hypothetical protein [Rhodospirillaceae bacterium]
MTKPDFLSRATGYPYAAPAHDYLFRAGRAEPLDPGHDLDALIAVLAIGSNRAPEQLARKFGEGPEMAIPVTWGRLDGFDVVYSAHMAGYGSIPATVHASPGTSVSVAVTWLTEKQLARMHETEAVGTNYDYGRISSEAVRLSDGRTFSGAGCYIGRRGALALDGEPVALAEIAADGRTFTAEPQLQMLDRVHSAHGTGEAFEPWLAGHVESPDRRKVLTDRLALTAEPFDHPAFAFDR